MYIWPMLLRRPSNIFSYKCITNGWGVKNYEGFPCARIFSGIEYALYFTSFFDLHYMWWNDWNRTGMET